MVIDFSASVFEKQGKRQIQEFENENEIYVLSSCWCIFGFTEDTFYHPGLKQSN